MRFIAIDSSLCNTGVVYGTIDENNNIHVTGMHLCETLKTKNKQIRASSDTIVRCRETYRFVHNIINAIKPDVVFVETPSGSQQASGMKSYGVTCALIASINPDPIEVTPIEVKVAFMGNKTASKESIIEKASKLYPSLPWQYHAGKLQAKNEHCADAIAIVHAGIKTSDFKRLQNILTNGKVL